MPVDTTKKWFTAIPLVWRNQPAFWEREAGVLCLGFRALGLDAKLVLVGEPQEVGDLPLILGRQDQLEDPAWWRSLGVEGVVLYSWAAPRFEPIARAIQQSGTKLILRMDSDGLAGPRVWFWRFLSVSYFLDRDMGRKFPWLSGAAKAILFRCVPSLFERPFLQHLSHAERIVIESPIARQRLCRLLHAVGRDDLVGNIRVIPAQVRDEFHYDPAVAKRRQILAVGRWQSAQKDAPMLVRVLARVLEHAPDYTALIVGSGEDLLHRLLAHHPAAVQSRVKVLGGTPHTQLRQLCQESQILFFSSRFEGFPNIAAEALCSGCSVVGPALIASLNYCASHSSGTVACTRRAEDLADALGAEIDAWRGGDRDPQAICAHWRPRLSASAVARRILACLE